MTMTVSQQNDSVRAAQQRVDGLEFQKARCVAQYKELLSEQSRTHRLLNSTKDAGSNLEILASQVARDLARLEVCLAVIDCNLATAQSELHTAAAKCHKIWLMS